MAEKFVGATASRKVELAVGELNSLSVPPGVAVQYLSKLLQGGFSPPLLADIIEAEPALAAGILSLAQRQAAGPARQRHAIRLVLDRLDADDVRDVLLRTKVAAGFEIEFADEQPALPARKDLVLHSLGVACCARRIAEAAGAEFDPQLAYFAGLLHDIGKLALQDIMPKSLAAIAREAEAAQAGLDTIEQKHLGTNHALLGKQLAQKWRLPDPIILAIWLHHRDATALFESVPEAMLAVYVKAADSMARQAGIGQSGSFDASDPLADIAETVDVSVDTLQQILRELPQEVKRRSAALGLDTPHAIAKYCDLVQSAAAELSERHTKLARAGQPLQTASGYLDFVREFLLGIRANVAAVEVAEDFARRWQRFFQTGTVCLYLTAGSRDGALDAAVVESLGHSHKTVLEPPVDGSLVPRPIATRFALIDAQDHIDWLLDQLDIDFNRDQVKLLPLFSDGQPVGVLAFELNYPADASLFAERFEMAASMAGSVLGLVLSKERQEHFAERLTRPNGKARRPSEPRAAEDPTKTLAEMAAGVAHELNNPLSVIAGRAQLLAQAEGDGQKRHVLDVIGENAREAAGVIDELMVFAQPPQPRPAAVSISQVIEEAIELARQKTGAEHVNAQIHLASPARPVFVDSAQVASGVANIIANAVESYPDPMGPVKITATPGEAGLRLQISDLGCGMDAETLRKAAAPFFSAKPAGRQRGMGLALAGRLFQLNRATLSLESQPGRGTTATITLPCE
jgi:putative nucleotidyltransferase with HDIG domain